MSLLMIGTPSEKVMSQYYNLGSVPFSVSEFIPKALIGLRDAVVPSGGSELITEFPIIVTLVVALFVFRKDDSSRVLWFWMLVVGVIYAGTSTVFQPQNRYIYPLVPFAAVFGAGLLHRFIRPGTAPRRFVNLLKLASVCFLIICISGSFLMARAYRTQARTDVAQSSKLIAGLAGEPSGSVLAVCDTSTVIPLTYAAVPRPVLALDPRINSTAEAARLIETWKVRILAGASDTELLYFSQAVDLAFHGRAKLIPQSSYGTPGGPIKLWLIEPVSMG